MDIVHPDAPFDAQANADMAFEHVSGFAGKGIVAFVVGGTGLYIKSLVFGLFDAEPSDLLIRKHLKSEANAQGNQRMYQGWRHVTRIPRKSFMPTTPIGSSGHWKSMNLPAPAFLHITAAIGFVKVV